MTSLPAIPPVIDLGPPPSEISALAQLCYEGDLGDKRIDETFYECLRAYERENHPLDELWPVLLSAVELNRPGIIKFLLSRGLPMNEMYINQAIKTRSKEVFQAFFDCGWDVNTTWNNFRPPVLASFVDDPELTQWFLDRGADLNARCYLDITPLSLAVRDAEPSFVHTLLNRGDIRRGQLVHYAVERSQNTVEVLDMLISKGASFDEVQYHNDQESWDHEHFKGLGTPLFRAAELGKLHVVEYLLGKGSDKAKRNTKDQTPLDIAMKLEHTDVVTLLESFQPTL